MLPYFWYMLKVIICSGILFGYYWIFLRNKLFHQYNRFYLLAAMVLSLLLPLLKINFWQEGAQTNQAIQVLRAVSAGDEYVNNVVISSGNSYWDLQNLYPLLYWSVSLLFLMIMLRTLLLIYKLLNRYPVQRVEEVSFVNTSDDSTPFSFFKYIFWNSNIDIATTTGRQIFKHEVAHIQEKHTYDKLFINITLIFCWCNPFFWLYRKELNMIHEFIADKKAVEDSDTAAFAAMILQATYPKHRFELTNNFFYSPIKRRLLMLTKIDNPKVSYMARVMVLPLALLVFAAFTFKTKSNHSIYNGKKITVVIDAGHGGQDKGASSLDKEIYEKDLTLAIAKKVKELNANDKISIILTREDDRFIPVQDRIESANTEKPNLYISIHVDNGPGGSENTKSGINFYVPKDELKNAEQSKILASALIGEFSNNYPLNVANSPKHRAINVWTLRENIYPSVLIEAGYINNNKDIAYLKTDAAKETIAKNILNAIEKFLTGTQLERNIINDTLPVQRRADKITDTVNKKLILEKKLQELELQKLKQELIILEQQNKDKLIYADRQAQLKVSEANVEALKLKLKSAAAEQENQKQQYVERLEKMKTTDLNQEKVVLEKKLQELQLQKEKQKLLAIQEDQIKQQYEEKLAQLKNMDTMGAKVVMGKQIQELKLQKEKLNLTNDQLAKIKEDYAEKLALMKTTDPNMERVVVGNKLQEVELENLKNELLVKERGQEGNKIFVKVEQGPQFTGGQDAWRKYLAANLKSTIPVEEGWKAGKYTVIVKFIVHTDGTVSDVTTENYNGSKTAQHCIDVIKNAPKWQPAVQNGKKVNAYHTQPITFMITEK